MLAGALIGAGIDGGFGSVISGIGNSGSNASEILSGLISAANAGADTSKANDIKSSNLNVEPCESIPNTVFSICSNGKDVANVKVAQYSDENNDSDGDKQFKGVNIILGVSDIEGEIFSIGCKIL